MGQLEVGGTRNDEHRDLSYTRSGRETSHEHPTWQLRGEEVALKGHWLVVGTWDCKMHQGHSK
jgi:hypothetical protein